MAKTFETVLKIGAKYNGAPAFGKLEKDLSRAHAAAHKVGTSLRNIALGAGAAALAGVTAAAYGLAKGLGAAYDAALNVEKTQEALRKNLDLTAERWGLSTAQIEKQQQAITALGDRMASLGPDGESVVAMLGEVSRAVDPRDLNNYTKGLTDLVYAQRGVNASEEDFKEVGAEVAKLIEFSMPKALKQFKGVTAEQIEEYKKLETREERQIWFFKNIAKETGATEKAFASASGKVVAFWNRVEDMSEGIGKPLVAMRGQFADIGNTILTQLEPYAKQFTDEFAAKLQVVAQYLTDNKDRIADIVKMLGDGTLKAMEFAGWLGQGLLKSIEDTSRQWGIIIGAWNKSIVDTKAQWDWLTSGLVSGAQAAWDKIKAIWEGIAEWFNKYVTRPVMDSWNRMTNPLGISPSAEMTPAQSAAAVQQLRASGGYNPGAITETPQDTGGWGTSLNPQIQKQATISGKAASVTPSLQAKYAKLQEEFGPIPVNSGYRSPSHNAAVGGAKGSRHTHGDAMDLDVSSRSIAERQKIITRARQLGIGGVGAYKNALHIDEGATRAWGPSYGRESLPGWAEGAVQTPRGGGLNGAANSINGSSKSSASASPTFNSNVTVNAQTNASPDAIAAQVKQAVAQQNTLSTKQWLATAKEARNNELRLAT